MMMIMIVKIILLSWLVSQTLELFQLIRTNFNLWKLLGLVLSCLKCVAFWIGLALTGNIFVACGVSLIAYVLDRFILSRPMKL